MASWTASAALLSRARERCRDHLPARGVCRECLVAEMEEMLLEANPELCRGDAFELVQEWRLAASQFEH